MTVDSLLRTITACVALTAALSSLGQYPAVPTAEYDNARTTQNNAELILNPDNVKATKFGKKGEWQLDGTISSQPLYVPGLSINKRLVNVVFVATMNNSVYAFDADSATPSILWHTNLGPFVPARYSGSLDPTQTWRCPSEWSTGNLGILSTPVIDASAKTMYVVAATPIPDQGLYKHTLYALDLATGIVRKNNGSVDISAVVPGTAPLDSSDGKISMGPAVRNLIQRPALLLSKNNVYVGLSGCGPDPSPYHGWILGYNAANLKQVFAYTPTPNGDEGGIWHAGRGLVGDSSGSVYFETGNGTYTGGNLGESFVKLSFKGDLQDWYTPPDVQKLSDADLDLSTTSPLFTPDTGLIVGSGKQGTVYVMSASSMEHSGPALQTFSAGIPCSGYDFSGCQKVHSMAYWQSLDGPRLFVWPTGDNLYSYKFRNGQFTTTADSQNKVTADYPGGSVLVTSALGVPSTGIVWGVTSPSGGTQAALHAFLATDLTQELWNSNMNAARDQMPGLGFHFEQYLVVGGKAYVPVAGNRIFIYGLL